MKLVYYIERIRMHITYKGDYALKTILDLALHYGNSPVTISELAKRADIPIKFLEQILLDLKRGDVIRFIDGPIEPIACTEKKYSGCNDLHKCVFRRIWQEVGKTTSDIVDNITFEDLASKVGSQQGTLAYYI